MNNDLSGVPLGLTMKRPAVDIPRCVEIARTCTYFNVRKASRALAQVFDEALRPCRLRGTQFSLLVALAGSEGATVNKLADYLQMDRTTLTRNVAPLERDGLVKSAEGEDGRERRLHLTA